tara:strand:- start:12 stop:161 length:150 start_codon:yes stop_codon:yes gene_type:complete
MKKSAPLTFSQGMILDMEVYEMQKIGGIDACGECARKAEAEYQVWRQHG